jgi:cell wall assembly regulator SMI1
MARRKPIAKTADGRSPRRSPPLPPFITPSPLSKKLRAPTQQLAAVDGKVRDEGHKGSVLTTTSHDEETNRAAKKHEAKKSATNVVKTNTSERKSNRNKTIKPGAAMSPSEIPLTTPPKGESISRRPGELRESQKVHKPIIEPRDKDQGFKMRKANGRKLEIDSTTEATPRRSQRQRVAQPIIDPAPPLIRGVNKYGFNIWVPAIGPADILTSRNTEKATAEPSPATETNSSDDVSVDHIPDSAVDGEGHETLTIDFLSEDTRDDEKNEVVGQIIKDDLWKSMGATTDTVDDSSIGKCSGTVNDLVQAEQDANPQDAGDQEKQLVLYQDVEMVDVVDAENSITDPSPSSINTAARANQPSSPGSTSRREVVAAEPDSPLNANLSVKRPTPDLLSWRAADRMTATGVHFFNIPVEDLREMTRLQALERARPQSSEELRALFVSATTSSRFTLEEYTLADARVKLQAGRNAMYGIHLRERMATMRMAAARATQQPHTLIEQLEAITTEARQELDAAQKALYEDFLNVAVAKQNLKNVTGKPVVEPHDVVAEEEASRRDKMIKEISTAIAEYEERAVAPDSAG